MSAPAPVPADAPTERCGRCGSLLPATGGTVTCQECLLTDLRAETLTDWLIPEGDSAPTGLKAAGSFTLLEEIGHGGMGRVYRARQQSPDREVAVKVLMPHLSGSEETRRRFLAESAVMAGLDHPGLLPLYACGETDGRPWLATRLANGGNLAQRRKSYEGRWQAIAELTARLAEAIQHAHARGIIHRDLKPSNILFDSHGTASVADFGLAKWRDENTAGQTLSHAVMGTPAYMAPELAIHGSRGATTAADVYGLGAILYELLTGQAPHVGSTPVEILHRVTTCDPLSPRLLRPDVPRDLAVICQRALARLPGDRYESAAALAADLQRYLNGYPVTARPYSLTERGLRWARRHPMATGLMVLLAAVLTGSASLLIRKNTELTAADARWRRAADDAEARVAYAIEVMPDKLAPLGRLSDLDDLFSDVAAHYLRAREAPSSDPGLAQVREAFFNLQWGRVLRPQGRSADAEWCFRQAEQIAAQLTRQPEAPARAWALLAQSRQSLGLMALRQGNGNEANRLLNAAINDTTEGLKRFPAQPELLVARAEALGERCDALLAGEGGEPAALDALEAAWCEAIAGNPAATPEQHQQYARDLAKVLFYRGDAAQKRGNWGAAETHFRALLQERERLANLPTATNEDRCAMATACNRVVRAMLAESGNPGDAARGAEIKTLVARQQEIMALLLKSDPTNLHWRAEAALMCLQEAGPFVNSIEYPKAIPPLQRAAELVRGVPDEVNRSLETGRSTILHALTRLLTRRAGKLSQAATAAATQGPADGPKANACAAAEEAFVAAGEACQFDIANLSRNFWFTICGIWDKHAPAGHARRRLESALADPSAAPGWKNLIASQLVKMDAATAAAPPTTPSPPGPANPSPP